MISTKLRSTFAILAVLALTSGVAILWRQATPNQDGRTADTFPVNGKAAQVVTAEGNTLPLLTEDWPMAGHDPERTAWNAAEKQLRPPLRVVWQKAIQDYVVDGISVGGGLIYLTGMEIGHKNQVRALDLVGEPKWDYMLAGGGRSAMDNPPAYHDGTVYFGGQRDTSLYALDRTGAAKWTVPTLQGMYGSPAVVCEGRIYAFGSRGGLHAVDTESGRVVWSQAARGWAGKTAVQGDVITAVSWETPLTAYNRTTGQKLWQRSDVTVNFSDVVAHGEVVFTASKGRVLALELSNGHTVWSTALPHHPTLTGVEDYNLALAAGTLYVAGGVRSTARSPQAAKILLALNSQTGGIMWNSEVSASWRSLAVANGVVYSERTKERSGPVELVAMDAQSGLILWLWHPPNSRSHVQFAIAKGTMYVASHEGTQRSLILGLKGP